MREFTASVWKMKNLHYFWQTFGFEGQCSTWIGGSLSSVDSISSLTMESKKLEVSASGKDKLDPRDTLRRVGSSFKGRVISLGSVMVKRSRVTPRFDKSNVSIWLPKLEEFERFCTRSTMQHGSSDICKVSYISFPWRIVTWGEKVGQ